MRKILSTLGLLACALAAQAQVNVEVLFDQEQFLRGESIPARIKIDNFSGQTLNLGNEADWIHFTVTGTDGTVLKQVESMPRVKPFTIDSAKSAVVRTDLSPFFDMNITGQYGVTVRMNFPQLQKELTTDVKKFTIVSGVKVWEKEVGLPGTTPPVVRKFSLQQATMLKETRLYARVTDATENEVIAIIALGNLPSASRPEAAVDNLSQMHVLHQSGQRQFIYNIVTPEGDRIIRQTHEFTTTRPRLKAEQDGRIVVSGGERRVTKQDLPPPPPTPSTNDVVKTP